MRFRHVFLIKNYPISDSLGLYDNISLTLSFVINVIG